MPRAGRALLRRAPARRAGSCTELRLKLQGALEALGVLIENYYIVGIGTLTELLEYCQ